MIGSKYSRYNSDQFLDEEYMNLCKMLLSMTKDEQIAKKMERNTL